MPSPPAYTIYTFGLSALLSGTFALLQPSEFLKTFTLPLPATAAPPLGLAAIAMGLYYTLAAYQENRAFFVLSVPMRLLTTAVFWRMGAGEGLAWQGGWRGAAVWEGVGALGTGIALLIGGRGRGKSD
ncbi:MAG: hypothetical protein MMC33_009999 [Icmadophila ericetorum]|nr:hypothetical protein [Icmadophila ericetorum]